MHILVVSPYLIGEHSLGGAKRIFRMIRYFAESHRVSYACFEDSQNRAHHPRPEIFALCPTVISEPVPTPGLFRKAVHYFFSPRPSSACFHDSPQLRKRIKALAATEAIDCIHVEFFDMATAIADVAGDMPRVLVSQEVLSCAKKQTRSILKRLKGRGQLAKIKAFEVEISRGFDRVYCITEEERDYLHRIGVHQVGLYPHVVDTVEFSPPKEAREEDGHLLFLGNFDHQPNTDALVWFVEEIWPLVKQACPAAVFHVVGPNLRPPQRERLAEGRIIFHGEVENLHDAYERTSVFVNPIISGGGMRGKVLEAMAKGKAIVSTQLGVMGIAVRDGEDVLLAEGPQRFATAIINLLQNKRKRVNLSDKARATVCERYDERIVFARLLNEYSEMVRKR